MIVNPIVVGGAEPLKKYSISDDMNIGFPSDAYAGEWVSITYGGIAPTFAISGNVTNHDIPYNESGSGITRRYYSFVMPDEDVTIKNGIM